MSETKTYVFGNDGQCGGGMMSLLAPLLQRNGLDPNLLLEPGSVRLITLFLNTQQKSTKENQSLVLFFLTSQTTGLSPRYLLTL